MRKKTLFVALLALCFCQVWAQQDSIALEGVEVVAFALDRNVGATSTVQTFSQQDFRNLGIDNVADAVKRFAGVNVRDYGGIGGLKTVSIHNLGAHHTAVSYDGVSISNTQAGQIDIGRYDTDNLESLALYMGDEDALMLPARQFASAGVLSMLSLRPRFDNGKSYALKLSVTGGSFGMVSPSLRYWQKLGARTSLSLQGKFMRADGIYPFTLRNGYTKTRERRYNSDMNSWQSEANLYHTFKDESELDVKAYWYRSKRGLPGVVILYANPSEERMWDEDFFAQTTYRRDLTDRLKLSAHLKYTHSWNLYRDWGSQYAGGMQTDENRQNEYYGSATLGWNIVKGLDMALAEDVSYNNLHNNIYVNINYDVPNPSRWTSITALVMKWRYGRLKVNGSMTYTYAAEHVTEGGRPADKKRMTPSLSLNYRLLTATPLYIRAMWKNTFRVPTFNDLYYRRLGNINLRPELAHEYSAGFTWSMRAGLFRYISFTADGYYSHVTDKIVAFPSTYVWRMVNYGRVEILGVDMTLGAQADIDKVWNLKASASATWQHAVDKTDETSQIYDNLIPYTPRWNGSGSIVLTTPWLNIGYTVMMQGSRYSMPQNKSEYRMPAFWEHSLTANREFQFRSIRLDLKLKATNFTNEQYEIIQYYPMPGRQFSAAATLYI